MLVTLLTPDDLRWVEFLAQTRHDFYHLPQYSITMARIAGGRAAAILAEDTGRRMLIPIIERPVVQGEWELRDAASPYGYPGPLILDHPAGAEAWQSDHFRALTGALREMGFVSLFLRSHPLIPADYGDPTATVVRHGQTVYSALNCTDDDLWATTRAGHRRDIRRAQRAGFEVRIEREPGDLDQFADLYLSTMTRLAAGESYLFGHDYFADLVKMLGQSLILASAWCDGTLGAASLFVETCGIVEYHLSASSDTFRSLSPTKLLLHEVRQWSLGQGYEFFHLGGGLGGNHDQLFEFKAGFGTGRATFATTRLVVDQTEYARAVAGRFGPGGLDDDARGFFPAYRMPG